METEHTDNALEGIRVLVTRAASQAPELSRALAAKGAVPVECPTITLAPPEDWSPVDRALNRLDTYSMILFTSANAVRFFMTRLIEKGVSPENVSSIPLVAIGPATARELVTHGFTPEPLPDRYVAESLALMLKGKGLAGKKILFPRALVARELLPERLRGMGAAVDLVVVYRTQKATENSQRLVEILDTKAVDLVTFTSSSTVKHFVEMVGTDRVHTFISGISIACIGDITAREAESYGLTIHVVPQEQTIASLVEAIVSFYGSRKTSDAPPPPHALRG